VSHILLTISVLLAHFLGGPTDRDTVKLKGVVLDPEGAPVAAAEVVATATEGIVYLEEVGTTETDNRGEFIFKFPARGTVSVSASKTDDYWLQSGDWEDVLENPGTAPVVDLKGDLSDLITIRLGSRGGKLAIETTDTEGSFWPSVVFINHCRSGSAVSSSWSPISVLYPDTEHLLPEGEYCVGIVSANRMYPVTPTCKIVQVTPSETRLVKLIVDPLELTTEVTRPLEGCSPQSEGASK